MDAEVLHLRDWRLGNGDPLVKKRMLDMLNGRIVPCPGNSDRWVIISGHRYGIGPACHKMTGEQNTRLTTINVGSLEDVAPDQLLLVSSVTVVNDNQYRLGSLATVAPFYDEMDNNKLSLYVAGGYGSCGVFPL